MFPYFSFFPSFIFSFLFKEGGEYKNSGDLKMLKVQMWQLPSQCIFPIFPALSFLISSICYGTSVLFGYFHCKLAGFVSLPIHQVKN